MQFNGSCWSTAGKNGKHHIIAKTASRKHIALLIKLRSVITVHFKGRRDFIVGQLEGLIA